MPGIVVTPAEQAQLGVKFITDMHDQRDRAMPILLPGEISFYVPPVLPGENVMVVGQTHNGKSLFMDLWARRYVKHLRSKGRQDEIVVWVDTEQPADYLATSQMAALSGISDHDVLGLPGLDLKKLLGATNIMADSGIYLIATRLGEDQAGKEVHLTNIHKGLQMLQRGEIDGTPHKIAAVFIDYLQSLPIDPSVKRAGIENQRRLQVSNDVDTLRRMGARLSCPTIVGVQAKQTLSPSDLQKAFALPSIYDGQETANIAQRPDRIISVSVAARNFPLGSTIRYNHDSFLVRESLLFVGVMKQRRILEYRRAGHAFAFDIAEDTSDPMRALAHVWSGWRP